MATLASGRGGGRIGGRGRGSPPPQQNRGLTPSIGAFLTCSGKGPSANETAIWAGKIKDYAMSNFETPIDDIFRANGATGEYPSRPEPELPEDEDDRVGFKVWEVAYVSKNRFDEKLAVEKIQLFGIMIGQMSEPSKDLIKETEMGREAFDNKDPLMLLKGAIQTHMSDSRLGAEQGLHKTQQVYNSLKMESGETVSGFYQKMKSSLAALEESHSRCGNDPAHRVDDESQRTIKFNYGLSNAYTELKGFYENKLLEFPNSLDAAFTEAST